MKTHHITAAFRAATTPAATTPAARLAAWQSQPIARRLRTLRERMARTYSPPTTLADARREAIAATGPELSAPENPAPLLWATLDSREILDTFAGREFLDHRGWFSDTCEQETLETYAVRLSRFPRLLFYAVRDSCSGDLRIHLNQWEEIDFSDFPCCPEDAIAAAARDLIRGHDSTTGREAEESREFYEKDSKERELEENRETLKALRPEIRALAHELRQPGNRANPDAPLVRAACKNLRALLADRMNLIRENRELAARL